MRPILLCSSIILTVIVYDVNAGMKDWKKLMKGGAILAGLMPHMMPLPLPIPIPIRMERDHHHTYPVCNSKPIHIHKSIEYVPYAVEEKKREPSVGKKGSEKMGEEIEEMGEEHSSTY